MTYVNLVINKYGWRINESIVNNLVMKSYRCGAHILIYLKIVALYSKSKCHIKVTYILG